MSSYGLSSTADGGPPGAGVVMTNRAGLSCATNGNPNVRYSNFDSLSLAFGEPATGTYMFVDPLSDAGGTAGQNQTALGTLYVTDAQCGQVMEIYASSGSVTVSSISSSAMAGTYTVTFGSQGTFTGSFDVDICPAPEAGIPGNGMTPACL
jgi:hypothetical protein